jgi:hypothetical protein
MGTGLYRLATTQAHQQSPWSSIGAVAKDEGTHAAHCRDQVEVPVRRRRALGAQRHRGLACHDATLEAAEQTSVKSHKVAWLKVRIGVGSVYP